MEPKISNGVDEALKRKSLSGLVWSAFEVWGRQFGTFIVFVVLARLLKPTDFGLVAAARIFLDLTQVFIRQGMSDAIVQREELRPDHLDTAFWLNVAIGAVAMVLCIVAAPFIETFMGIHGVSAIIIGMSPSLLLVSINVVQDGLLRRELKFKPLAIRRVGGTMLGGVIGLGMAWQGFGAWSLVGQQLASGLGGGLLLWYTTPWRPGFQVTRAAFHELFGFSIHIFGSNVVALISRRADTFLIGRFLGPAPLGLYDVATRVMWFLVMGLTSVANRVTFSAFSRISTEPEKIRSAFYEVTGWTAFVSFPAFGGVAVLSPWLVPVTFGPNWVGSIPVMQVITWLGITQSLAYFNSSVLKAVGKPRLSFILLTLSAIWNVLGFLAVLNQGIVAVAWVFLVGGILFLPLGVYWVKSLIGITWTEYLKNLAPSGLSTGIMVMVLTVVSRLLPESWSDLLMLAVLLPLGVLVHLGAASLLDRKRALQAVRELSKMIARKLAKIRRKSKAAAAS